MEFTNDKKDQIMTSLKKSQFVSQALLNKVEDSTLTNDDLEKLGFLLEGHVGDALNALSYDSVLEAQQDARFEEIRKANQRIQELEGKLAKTHELSGFSGMFNIIQDIIADWWKKEGFNHVRDTKLLSYGALEVTFNFALSMRVSMFSQNKKAEYEDLTRHIQSLRDMGFAFYDESEYDFFEKDLLDTEKNRELLVTLVQKRFPSFEVNSFESQKHAGTPVILSFTGTIHDVDNIKGGK